jgi:hypothetical protein
MIRSEILQEKQRVQKRLASESYSIHEYLVSAQLAAKEIAIAYDFSLHYADQERSRSLRTPEP